MSDKASLFPSKSCGGDRLIRKMSINVVYFEKLKFFREVSLKQVMYKSIKVIIK